MTNALHSDTWRSWLKPWRFVLCVLMALGLEAQATHLVGGELYYTHLGGSNYLVTLKVYRDCGPANTLGTGFDDQVYIGMWDGTGQIGDNDVLTIPLTQSNVSNVPVALGNPCGTPPPDLCIEQAIYSTTVSLPATSYGWDLVWQRCCRNPSISNLQNFGGTENPGATFVAHVPGTSVSSDATQNSSPVFQELPPVAVCANFDFVWDHSAIDPDGDELVYSFCAPLDGGGTGGGNGANSPVPNPPATPPYQEVEYIGGFSGTYPITSDPAMAIDPVTGVITGMPNSPGQYAIGICVSEYRDGELLSTTMRDFQFNVTLCDPNIQSVVAEQTPAQLCIGETITLDNGSINGSSYAWDFGVAGITDDVSDEFEPTYTWPEPGDYWVSLVVNPGWPCADTSEALYQVWQPLDPVIVVDGFECDDGEELFTFAVEGNIDGGASMLWDFGTGSPGLADIPNPGGIFFDNAEVWEIVVSVNNHGCTTDAGFTWVAPPDPVALVEDQYQFCTGLTFDFTNLSSNAEAYLWDFGDGVGGIPSGMSTDPSPSYTFPDTGVYEISLTAAADFTCPDVATAEVEIQFLLEPTFTTPDPNCLDDHFFTFSGTASSDENTVYEWDFGGATVLANTAEEQVTGLIYEEAGTYDVSLTASVPGLTGCVQTFTAPVTVIAEPAIDFQAGPWTGCPPHSVSFTNMSTTETATTYTWDFGDGSTSNAVNTSHMYMSPGVYPITLTMETGGYCVRTLAMDGPQSVEILPVPVAAIDVTPNQVDILNPVVWVEYLGDQNVDCYYSFGDGGGIEGCNGQYIYNDGGTFTINQTVVNEFGCTNTAEGQVSVSGSVFYAPTAFTPDGDGLNDVWLPVVRGVSNYALRITNRWGELVFETTDPEEPWLGQMGTDGQHYCPNGVYLYRAVYFDQVGYPRVAEGHLHVAR
ncbi:MAG: PKD domain-containing protein [Bacteroidota bacterium]|nr:PKD domain-containing protein [Bacteroidota bacterium]